MAAPCFAPGSRFRLKVSQRDPRIARRRSSDRAVEDSDTRLARRIREGKDEMPRFGSVLTEEQIGLIVSYLREVQGAG